LGVINPQIDAEMLVLQVELAAIAVIGIFHTDDRLPEVGQIEQEALLDLLELAAFDLVHLGLVVVAIAEELVAAAEIHRQSWFDKGHVVVDPPDLEYLLAT